MSTNLKSVRLGVKWHMVDVPNEPQTEFHAYLNNQKNHAKEVFVPGRPVKWWVLPARFKAVSSFMNLDLKATFPIGSVADWIYPQMVVEK